MASHVVIERNTFRRLKMSTVTFGAEHEFWREVGWAEKVAPEGKIYAVDITESFEHIKKTCKEQKIENVVCVVFAPQSAEFPAESVDLVFLCDTYHHFQYPFKMLDSICAALRTDGRLIVIDRKDASDHVRADKEKVSTEVIAAGFKFLDETKISEKEYLMRFQKVEHNESRSAELGIPRLSAASATGLRSKGPLAADVVPARRG